MASYPLHKNNSEEVREQTKYGFKHKKNCKQRNISDKTAYILILGIIKVLMDKDARSIGMPIVNLSQEVRH